MKRLKRTIRYLPGLLILLVWAVQPVFTQNIILDKIVKAGELTLFQSIDDENVYYYLSDKLRLATHENGIPKFSFLRYVENVRSGATEAEAREGMGGGIVHAVVSLSVTEEQLREARQELRRINSSGRIEGPIMYQGGTVALISSFRNEQGDLTEQVIGLGKSPVLDGQQAAVSVQLTKKGAKILWESFKTPTPDMTFSFEMEVTGYRSPKRAVIEANFDKIYEHHGFQAGIASTYLAAEIKGAFDDLRQEGAIKVTQIGEDEKMEELITTAYNKLTQMMFDPLGGSGTPNLAQLASIGSGGTSLLDRATNMLSNARRDAQAENERIRRENERLRRATRTSTSPAESASESSTTTSSETDEEAGEDVVRRPSTARATAPTASHEEGLRREREEAEAGRAERPEVSVPKFAIAASYEMKRIKHTGKFRIDLNKYTADNITMRFDENFGTINCEECFRQVNLDDPLYKQREIVAFVDGLNAQDFGNYINFVTVSMQKKHESGEITLDEVRIDRNNFSKEGNNFKLLYGWKGDNDRSRWFGYEIRAAWSFFGGRSVETDWEPRNTGAINLAPPFQRRIIDVEADPHVLQEAKIRAVNVKIYYQLAGEQKVEQVTLIPSRQQLSKRVEFMLPKDQTEYEYEIEWQIRGKEEPEKSGRKKTSFGILFADELPS